MRNLESEKQMIQSTNSSTPEIVAELQSILNQLEDSTDDIFNSIQNKLKIDLTTENPFSQNPNCETYSFSFFVQHFVLNQKLQKIELLSFMELKGRFEDGEMIYLNQTTEKFRGQIRFKFEEFYKKLLRNEWLTLSQIVEEKEKAIVEIKSIIKAALSETVKDFVLNYSETIDFFVSHHILNLKSSIDRKTLFNHLLKLINQGEPELLDLKISKSEEMRLERVFQKIFLKKQLEHFDSLNSSPLDVQSVTVEERKILLELIGTLDREKFTNKIEGYSILKTLGKVFGDELTGEIFWIPLLQQLKGEEEKLVRERKLPESNITYKDKIDSFISICERISQNDFDKSITSLSYFQLLSKGIHKLRFII